MTEYCVVAIGKATFDDEQATMTAPVVGRWVHLTMPRKWRRTTQNDVTRDDTW